MARGFLPSPLEAHVGYWLRYVSNHVSASFARKVEASGVTVSEWVVLRRMYGAESPSVTELATSIGMTKGAASKLVTRLETKALVSRGASAADARAQTLTLTPSGRALVPQLARLADENDEEVFGTLGAEARDLLRETLKSLVQMHGWHDVPVN